MKEKPISEKKIARLKLKQLAQHMADRTMLERWDSRVNMLAQRIEQLPDDQAKPKKKVQEHLTQMRRDVAAQYEQINGKNQRTKITEADIALRGADRKINRVLKRLEPHKPLGDTLRTAVRNVMSRPRPNKLERLQAKLTAVEVRLQAAVKAEKHAKSEFHKAVHLRPTEFTLNLIAEGDRLEKAREAIQSAIEAERTLLQQKIAEERQKVEARETNATRQAAERKAKRDAYKLARHANGGNNGLPQPNPTKKAKDPIATAGGATATTVDKPLLYVNGLLAVIREAEQTAEVNNIPHFLLSQLKSERAALNNPTSSESVNKTVITLNTTVTTLIEYVKNQSPGNTAPEVMEFANTAVKTLQSAAQAALRAAANRVVDSTLALKLVQKTNQLVKTIDALKTPAATSDIADNFISHEEKAASVKRLAGGWEL